jgi:hypothetical protein
VIIERKNKKIADVREAAGSVHDFKLFKDSTGDSINETVGIDADPGCPGLEKPHGKSRIPKKASNCHKLARREKEHNTRLAPRRVVIEHINAKIKTFKSMSYPYRNHRTRHLLRMSLICGIINFELCL